MKSLIDSINYSENVIPQSLRLCDSLFTLLVIFGKFNEVDIGIPPHVYEEYNKSLIVTVSSPINGVDTDYYDGLKNSGFGDSKFLVPFKHCQLK